VRARRIRRGGGHRGLRDREYGGKGEDGGNEESRHCITLYKYIPLNAG
jgi:hypothetical protein